MSRHHKPKLTPTLAIVPLLGVAGCWGHESALPEDRPESALPTVTKEEAEAIDLERRESSQSAIATPESLTMLPPAAILAANEETTAVKVASPMRIRVTRRPPGGEERQVVAYDASRGGYLFVSRYAGVKFSGDTVVSGPLEAGHAYLFYLDPPGGVRREVTRTRVRPITDAELADERERLREEGDRPPRRRRPSPAGRLTRTPCSRLLAPPRPPPHHRTTRRRTDAASSSPAVGPLRTRRTARPVVLGKKPPP